MKLIEDLLNEFFSGAPNRMKMRNQVLVVGAVILWLLMGIIGHPPSLVVTLIQTVGDLLISTVKVPFQPWLLNAVIGDMFKLAFIIPLLMLQVLRGLLAADVMRHMVAIIVPVFLAFRVAVLYLDDIFELNDQRTAFRYLRAAAFGIQPFRITIEKGEVSPADKKSPLLLIGGPGRVQVNLENVAVFDRLSGQPHIVGPTVNRGGNSEVIGSFERLRSIIDLRNQMTSNSELAVDNRTRDGIPLSIRDVRIDFSVLRDTTYTGGNPNRLIYSFRDQAIFNLVYNRPPGPWSLAMTTLVRGQLAHFIASHTSSEILASIGLPEIEERQTVAIRLNQQAENLSPGGSSPTPTGSSPPISAPDTPNFISRLELTDLFHNPKYGFPKKAAQRGVQLHWINVGTLLTIANPLTDLQISAWKLSLENEKRRREIKNQEEEYRLEELLRLIRENPIFPYFEATQNSNEFDETVDRILTTYERLLRAAINVYEMENQAPPDKLETAIQLISRCRHAYNRRTGRARYLQ